MSPHPVSESINLLTSLSGTAVRSPILDPQEKPSILSLHQGCNYLSTLLRMMPSICVCERVGDGFMPGNLLEGIDKRETKLYYKKVTKISFQETAYGMKEKLIEEEKNMRRLRFIVDLAQAILMQQPDLTLQEAFTIMRDTKKAALNLFPDKENVYDLIYASRFRKIITERFVIQGGLSKRH